MTDHCKWTPRMELEPGGPVQAGSMHTWTLTYTSGQEGILPGGALRIAVDLRGGISPLQINDPAAAGFVRCFSSDGVELRMYTATVKHPVSVELVQTWNPQMSTNLYVVDILVQGSAGVQSGEQIVVVFGDQSGGGPGLQAPVVATDEMRFWVMVNFGRNVARPDCPREIHFSNPKASGTLVGGTFVHTVGSPAIRVLPGPVEHLQVIAPSRLRQAQDASAFVASQDKYRNRVQSYRGRFTVPASAADTDNALPIAFDPIHGDSGSLTGSLVTGGKSLVRIEAEDPAVPIKVRSNPAEMIPSGSREMNIYWGDIHGHTLFSDGSLGDADDYFNYARDTAGLDFCALTDHDFGLAFRGSGTWEQVQRAVSRHNDPGSFITMLAFESTHCRMAAGDGKAGHKNVYFPDDHGTLVNTSYYYGPDKSEIHGSTVEDLFRGLDHSGAMIIAHQNSNTDWSFHHPMQRLVEIYSKWGCSESAGCEDMVSNMKAESSVQNALAEGHRLGFVAGSDTHIAQPGNSSEPDPGTRTVNRPGGLTAVLAESLTREALWEALWDRRVYATTGARIILDVRANGLPMGQSVAVDDSGSLSLNIKAVGTAVIERVEIIKNGESAYTEEGRGEQVEFEWQDATPAPGACYYVRLRQQDGHRAWTSPIWIE